MSDDNRGPLADKLEDVVKQVLPVEPDTGAHTQEDPHTPSPPSPTPTPTPTPTPKPKL